MSDWQGEGVRIYPVFTVDSQQTGDGLKMTVTMRLPQEEINRQAWAILDAIATGQVVLISEPRPTPPPPSTERGG